MTAATQNLADLYLEDETAWLDAMAERIQAGALDELDFAHLQEYLSDMAARDRREVKSRLIVLLAHILKWTGQPDHRTRGWVLSILEQRQELQDLVGKGVLQNHAREVLQDAYSAAVLRASAETGLEADDFDANCPYTLEDLLAFDPVLDQE
jgi:hypothetical protein